MQPEGMVHALEVIRGLLTLDGVLVDIRPTGLKPRIVVLADGIPIEVGRLEETDDFIEYHQAAGALKEAIGLGWFEIEASQRFIYKISAGSRAELQDFLAAEWKDAVLTSDVITRIDNIYDQSAGDCSIVIMEWIKITVLRLGASNLFRSGEMR
jgi:hypothetical protein